MQQADLTVSLNGRSWDLTSATATMVQCARAKEHCDPSLKLTRIECALQTPTDLV